MRLSWLKDPDNIVHAEIETFTDYFGKEAGIANFREKIEHFRRNPTAEGETFSGHKRTSVKLFIPDLMFDEHIEEGETVWVYMGDHYPSYCLFWPESVNSLKVSKNAKSDNFLLSEGEIAGKCSSKQIRIPVLTEVRTEKEKNEDSSAFMEVSAELTKDSSCFAMEVPDTSMEPLLCKNDICIVRKQEIKSDDLVIVVIEDRDAMIRNVIERKDGGILLTCPNLKHQSEYFSAAQIEELPVMILGKVIELRRSFA